MKKILLLGANGQLGTELHRAFRDAGEIITRTRETCDLSDAASIRGAVREAHPDIILNAAAYTAVDRAETEPALAMCINGDAPGVLAVEAKKTGALLIHYSTDYVFDGTKSTPWVEDDPVHPLNVYGQTKLAGERNVQQAGGKFLIFRTSWVFSRHGHNFLSTMLRLGQECSELKIVNDQKGAPTSASAIASATRRVTDALATRDSQEIQELYHMTCAGETTWAGFAQAIFARTETKGPWARVTAIPSSEYPTPAARPANSVLSNEKLKAAFHVELFSWESALDESLRSLKLQSV